MAPAGLPGAVLAKLREATRTALDAELSERLARLGYDVHASEPKQVTQTITRDLTRWREVADRARISLD